MQTRSWCLLALLAGCASREPGEPELGWTPSDDSDIGPVYALVSDRPNDDTSARVHVVDVSEPGGGGDRAVVLEALADIEDPELSPSRRWAAIGVRPDLHLIDFAGDPLAPARAIERPGPGSFNRPLWYEDRFAADDSGLVTLFTPDGDERSDLYYVPLLESGPLVPIEVTMPDGRWPSANHRFSDDGRWLVFFGDDDDDGLPAGIYVSEIIGGQPSPAVSAHEASPPLWLGDALQVAGGAAFFETWSDSPEMIRDLYQLRRLDLETFEVQTLTDLEPESRQWFASADGSRVLFKSGGYGEGSIDYIEIIAGEPQPATQLSLDDGDPAWAYWAGFLTPDGRYGLAQANVGHQTFVAWFDFEGPTPTRPAGVEANFGVIDWDGRWISAATPDGRVLLIDPVLGLVQKIDLPPPWLATHVRMRPEGTRTELLATEGPTINDTNDGVWTLRTADELGPPLRFDHPTQPGQALPIWWNAEYIPTSERHFYGVDEGGERWTIWENDGLDSRTALMEVRGDAVALLVVAPQW